MCNLVFSEMSYIVGFASILLTIFLLSFSQKKPYFMQYFIFIIKQVVYNYIGLNVYDFCIFINKIIY